MSAKKRSKSKPQKKNSSRTLVILVLLALVAAAAVYFLRPDLFNAGKTAVLDLITRGLSTTQTEASPDKTGQKPAPRKTPDASLPGLEENSPLYFGNPSGAISDTSASENLLLEKKQFSMSYNAAKLIPNWVAWHLSQKNFGQAERGDDFRPDTDLPENYYRVKKADYQYAKYGFDRGHVCPSADRTSTPEDNSTTFLMTNMIPQSPNCNRNVWKNLESYQRSLALSGKELYILAGPYGRGGTSDRGRFEEIPLDDGRAIEVPEYCWKIIMVLDEGEEDFYRVDADTDVIAAWIPNNQVVSDFSWDYYITTVDFIEEKTGHDFFAHLPDEIEDCIEAKIYVYEK